MSIPYEYPLDRPMGYPLEYPYGVDREGDDVVVVVPCPPLMAPQLGGAITPGAPP